MNIKITYLLMAACVSLSLASCSEGQYWNEPDTVGNAVAFAKPAAVLKIGATETAPTSFEVTVSRTQAGGAETVPVSFSTNTPDVLSGAESVTFKAGEYTAPYIINIKDIAPGIVYSALLGVENPEGSLLHVDSQNLTFTFNITQQLIWKPAGTASVTSLQWVENVTGVVKVEEGNWPVAGQRLFRLVDVYDVLEPDVAEDGCGIPFLTDDSGKAIGMFQEWSYIGEEDNDGNMLFFGCPAAYGGSFTNQGNNYVMNGVIGYAPTAEDEVTPGWYETLNFVWDIPAR